MSRHVAAEVAGGAVLGGWKNCPKQRSPGPASGATTRGETCKLLPARYCRSKVDSTDPGVGGGAYGDSRDLVSTSLTMIVNRRTALRGPSLGHIRNQEEARFVASIQCGDRR
jgi:hypothetical protein